MLPPTLECDWTVLNDSSINAIANVTVQTKDPYRLPSHDSLTQEKINNIFNLDEEEDDNDEEREEEDD